MNTGGTVRMAVCVTSLASACLACSAQAPPSENARDAAPTAAPMAQTDATPATAPTQAPDSRGPGVPPTREAAANPAPPPPRPRIDQATVEPPALPTTAAVDVEAAAPVQLTINALSRGKGVPAGTRDAFKQIRMLLEQQQANAAVTEMQLQRLGLEGESRLCVEFRNRSDAQATLARIRTLSTGVDLLEVVETPCPSSKEYKP